MDVSFREILRTTDAASVQLAAGLLRDAGLDARIRGTLSGAAIGVGEQILEKRLEVPAGQEARARALLADWLEDRDEEEDEDEDEDDEDEDEADVGLDADEDGLDEEDAEAPAMQRRMRNPLLRWTVAFVIVGPVVVGMGFVLVAMLKDALR